MNEVKLREIFKQACSAEPLAECWPDLEKFGRAVAEAEREICAFMADDHGEPDLARSIRRLR